MTLDKWSRANWGCCGGGGGGGGGGDCTFGLSFNANERIPPKLFKWECTVPSFLVGGSFVWYIMALCWMWCAHIAALVCGGCGLLIMCIGIWFSTYLQQGGDQQPTPEVAPENEEDIKVTTMESATSRSSQEGPILQKRDLSEAAAAVPPSSVVQEPPPPPPRQELCYDPEDNVLGLIAAKHKKKSNPPCRTRNPAGHGLPVRSAATATATAASSKSPTTRFVEAREPQQQQQQQQPAAQKESSLPSSPTPLSDPAAKAIQPMMVKGRSLGSFEWPPVTPPKPAAEEFPAGASNNDDNNLTIRSLPW